MADPAQLSIAEINEINEFGFHLSSALRRRAIPDTPAQEDLDPAGDSFAAGERRLSPGVARALFVVKP